MVIEHRKGVLASAWIMTAGIVGVLGNVTSLGTWALILGCGLAPPLLMLCWKRVAVRTPGGRSDSYTSRVV